MFMKTIFTLVSIEFEEIAVRKLESIFISI